MNRKFAIFFSAVLIAFPVSALAFTSCRDTDKGCTLEQLVQLNNDAVSLGLATSERIVIMQEMIVKLTTQIAQLQSSGNTNTSSATCLDLNNALVIGSTDATTNGEVSKLQQFLISAGVYPEARITGYYGTLTAQAVVRWQKAHGMDFVTLTSGIGPMTRGKMACVNAVANSTSSSSITFTSPAKGDVLRTGSIYTAKWTGQSNSDQTLVTLKATDPMCWNVGLVAEGERGCSATELGKVKLADGSFQLNLNVGMSPLSQLGNRDNKANYILFFDTPPGRVISQTFTVSGNDFSIGESYHGKDLYTPGETINFSAGGRTDTGEALSPELGFSAKVFLEWGDSWGPGGSAIYREGTYNASQGRWDFTTTAPMTRKNDYDYRIFVYVKCSDVNKCAARYPNLLEKDLIIRFNVSSNNVAAGNSVATQTIPIRYMFNGRTDDKDPGAFRVQNGVTILGAGYFSFRNVTEAQVAQQLGIDTATPFGVTCNLPGEGWSAEAVIEIANSQLDMNYYGNGNPFAVVDLVKVISHTQPQHSCVTF